MLLGTQGLVQCTLCKSHLERLLDNVSFVVKIHVFMLGLLEALGNLGNLDSRDQALRNPIGLFKVIAV